MSKRKARAQYFSCPECGRSCKLEPGENRSAVSHALPECDTWKQHKKGKAEAFLMLAQQAAMVRPFGAN